MMNAYKHECLIKNKMFIQTGPRCLINKCPVITGHYNLYSTIYGIVAISALRISLCVSNHCLHVQDKE